MEETRARKSKFEWMNLSPSSFGAPILIANEFFAKLFSDRCDSCVNTDWRSYEMSELEMLIIK